VLRGQRVDQGDTDDLTPRRVWPEPTAAIPLHPDSGPVMVTIEYCIDEADTAAFVELMQESRRSRLQRGALSWGLWRDSGDPQRYTEYYVDASWVEHLRRFDRVTAVEVRLRQRREAFHRGLVAPVIRRHVAQPVER
jgi:hypothetical protein